MAINRKQRIKTAYLLSGTTTIKLMKRMQTTWTKENNKAGTTISVVVGNVNANLM